MLRDIEGIKADKTKTNRSTEPFQIITGPENITNFVLEHYLTTRATMDACFDFVGPSVVATDKRIMAGASDMKKRGIKIRLITDVTKDNIQHCKKIMEVSEIRHLDGVKGNFGILDGTEYNMHLIHQDSHAPTQMIYSNVKSLVDAQQFLYNSLWEKAIPIELRIKEIEDGVRPDFIEVIRDPTDMTNVAARMISLATEEMLIVFPSFSGFRLLERIGFISLLQQASKRGVRIRILTPGVEKIKDSVFGINKMFRHFDIRSFGTKGTRSVILISDAKFSLVIDLKDGMDDTSFEPNGLASYSNTESTVWTYSTIFEKLWIQSVV